MKLSTATIILPDADNAGSPLVDQRCTIETKLGHAFGGFTRTVGQGFWVDPDTGKDYRETVWVYSIAAEWNAGACIQLRSIARIAAEIMGQECIYIETPLLGVQFIAPLEDAAATAVA